MNVISCIQDEISVESQYEIKRIGSVGFGDVQLKSFRALHSVVLKKALADFGAILTTETFRDLCQSTIQMNRAEMNDTLEMKTVEDEVAIWLLQVILQEVKKIPLDVFFLTPKVATLPTRRDKGM